MDLSCANFVGVVKLANTLASGASAERLEGSNPSSDTGKILVLDRKCYPLAEQNSLKDTS